MVKKKFCRAHVYLGGGGGSWGGLGVPSGGGLAEDGGGISKMLLFGLEASGYSLGAALREGELTWSDVYVSGPSSSSVLKTLRSNSHKDARDVLVDVTSRCCLCETWVSNACSKFFE